MATVVPTLEEMQRTLISTSAYACDPWFADSARAFIPWAIEELERLRKENAALKETIRINESTIREVFDILELP